MSIDQAQTSRLRRAAISSGLLTAEQLRRTEQAAVGEGGEARALSDEQLAQKLVEFGLVNRWQAEQLKAGRSKFTLGPYRIIDSLGQGGMGRVFKAEHALMGRVVAIKVLPREKSTPLAIESFTREIRAQASLDHENLVRAYDAGQDGNVYFLVTEYVPGTDLRKLVRAHGKLGMHEAATIISQAAAGLAHAHERGLVHRDVKPGNLLVTPDGHTKVSDLGLAGFLVDTEGDPRAGKILGTADYLSPEHIRSPRNVTAVSDVYSLGCTLYYAVTGKVPFPGGTTPEKARRHCEDTPLNPRRLNPDLSEEFTDELAALMEKDPTRRVQTAAEVIDRLAPWAGADLASVLNESLMLASDSSRKLHVPLPTEMILKDTQPLALDELIDTTADTGHAVHGLSGIGRRETTPEVFEVAAEDPLEGRSGFGMWHAMVAMPILLAAGVLVACLVARMLGM